MQTAQKRSKSVSCQSLQKELLRECGSKSKGSFVPFCSERRLGRLISERKDGRHARATQEQLLERINFKNFQQVYKVVSDF